MRFFAIILALSASLFFSSCAQQEQARPAAPENEQDLAGRRIATVAGSCYDMNLSKRDDIELLLFNYDADALQALLTGRADVLVNDETVLNSAIMARHGIKVACKGSEHFPTAFMFNKDRVSLVEAMNALEAQMVQDGRLDSLIQFWQGEEYLRRETLTHLPPEPEDGDPLRVACICSMAPISFMVGDDWFGLEPDLARELARVLHRSIEFHLYDATSGMMAVRSGMADVMIGCIFVTPERQQEYLFADPYHEFGSSYYVMDHDAEDAAVSFWKRFGNSLNDNLIKEGRWRYITDGLWETVKISLLSILLGALLGVGLCAMARSRRRWLRSTAAVYNWLMAGIPMLVLLLILFYVVFAKSGLNPTTVAVFAFALNFASGASDVYGTSLDAVPRGQTEAGLALGFTRLQTFRHIVLPQALKRGLPLFQGQCVSLLKGTSIVGYIAIQDLTRAGDIIRSRTFDAFVPLLVVTVLYFILAWLIGCLVKLAMPKKHVL